MSIEPNNDGEGIDRDGAHRDAVKLLDEAVRVHKEMQPHYDRHFILDKDGHSYTNLFVEAARLSPYLIGHIDSVVWPLAALSIVGNVIAAIALFG